MTPVTIVALVAEDHPTYRARVVALLEGWGIRVAAAVDGREAITLLRRDAFDLLVTDLEMPHHTGFEVIDAWLRAGRPAAHVIMVTGEADAVDVRERCAAGSIRLIHKAAIGARFEPAVREVLRLVSGGAPDA